jgi:hypothetical protein
MMYIRVARRIWVRKTKVEDKVEEDLEECGKDAYTIEQCGSVAEGSSTAAQNFTIISLRRCGSLEFFKVSQDTD